MNHLLKDFWEAEKYKEHPLYSAFEEWYNSQDQDAEDVESITDKLKKQSLEIYQNLLFQSFLAGYYFKEESI